MKTTKHIKYSILSAFLFSFGLAGCASVSNESVEPITETDLEVASEIVGETLSSENSGVLSSVYDALSDIGSTGIQYTDTQFKSNDHDDRDHRAGRGRESNFSYSYDPETGTHTLDFEREVNRTDSAGNTHSKSMAAHLEYIFTDLDGDFIALPRWRNRNIETIDFKGTKSGELSTPNFESSFSRTDTLLFTGVHGSSPLFGLDGSHLGEGSKEGTTRDGVVIDRQYSVYVQFNNVEIDKAIVEENGNLEEGVSGTLTYVITYTNEEGVEETLEGEVLLEEDGTALLRFKGFSKVYRLNLRDGRSDNS